LLKAKVTMWQNDHIYDRYMEQETSLDTNTHKGKNISFVNKMYVTQRKFSCYAAYVCDVC